MELVLQLQLAQGLENSELIDKENNRLQLLV